MGLSQYFQHGMHCRYARKPYLHTRHSNRAKNDLYWVRQLTSHQIEARYDNLLLRDQQASPLRLNDAFLAPYLPVRQISQYAEVCF